ncbi:MAG TPA: CPBP family glutamic-type intramembrane protease [Mycobacteriales bacterium]|nr:CPBP family glutamic-type intramembrane protease [Mycobacteriales bacterium]
MSVVAVEPARPAALAGPTTLTLGFAGAVLLRAALAGVDGAASLRAGLAFAAVLVVLTIAARTDRPRLNGRVLALGLAGVAVLVLPATMSNGVGDLRPGFFGWAAATAVVATAEEAFLRGALFAALSRWRGADVAVVGSAVAFAALHVPLYGWHVLPLDLAVGLLLGALRLAAGTWAAPAVAHVGADLVGWWLV